MLIAQAAARSSMNYAKRSAEVPAPSATDRPCAAARSTINTTTHHEHIENAAKCVEIPLHSFYLQQNAIK
jgi:hypothetical protein